MGVFAPAASIPLLGSVSFLQNGRFLGTAVIVCALASVIVGALRHFWSLWITGGLTALFLSASLIAFQSEVRQMKHAGGGDKFLAGLESAAADAIQLEWGYAILFCGTALLFAAAAVGTGKLRLSR